MMICEKLPENKDEIVKQLAKQNITGLKSTALFFTGMGKQGRWNEQEVTTEYIMKIRPFIIEILDELK
jgi:hypothetical protein